MAVRVCTLSDTIVSAADVAQANIAVSITLLVPNGQQALDTNGEVVDPTPLSVLTNSAGLYAQAVIAPGDLTPTGCQYQVSYLSTTIVSPSFAYSASPIAPSSWLPSAPSTTGMIKMILTLVGANAVDEQGTLVTFALSQDSVWYAGGVTILASGGVPLATNSAGLVAIYLVPQVSLSTNGTSYYTALLPDGGILQFLCPLYPGGYRGAWNATTAYAVNDVVLSGGSYYTCTTANTNNAPPGGDWAVWAGEPVINHLIGFTPAGLPVPLAGLPTLGQYEVFLAA